MNKNQYQKIKLNNIYAKSTPHINEIIWNNFETMDESLIKSLNSKLYDTYHAKLNLVKNLLYSQEPLPLKDKKSIIKFFNILAPLNNEFNFGSYQWNYKMVDGDLYIQNSISKSDLNDYLRSKYIFPIRNILMRAKVNYKYYQIKTNRYYRNIDLIFVVKFGK